MLLQDIPITALFICYGPLLLTVGGFVVFAVLTDLNARRTYLRRDVKAPSRDRQVTAPTPAGPTVTIEPMVTDATSTAAAPPPPPSVKPMAPPAPSEPVVEDPAVGVPPPAPRSAGEPDALIRLEGIGPKTADALVAAGLDTFEKIAAASEDDFKAALETAGLNFTPSMESWAEQASYAAKGDWEGLAELQSTLISGRYPPKDE